MTAEQIIAKIAAEHLAVFSLKSANNDDKDFHELAVWQIKSALEAAFKAGLAAASSHN